MILKCQTCGKYTMNNPCTCGGNAITTRPAKYSPGKFAEHRRKAKREALAEKGLL